MKLSNLPAARRAAVGVLSAALIASTLVGIRTASAAAVAGAPDPRTATDTGQISTVYTDAGSGSVTGLNAVAGKLYLAENHADIQVEDTTTAVPAWLPVPLTDASHETFYPVDLAPAADGTVYFTSDPNGARGGAIDKAAPDGQVTTLATSWSDGSTTQGFVMQSGSSIRLDPTGSILYVTEGVGSDDSPLITVGTAGASTGAAITGDFSDSPRLKTLAVRGSHVIVAVQNDSEVDDVAPQTFLTSTIVPNGSPAPVDGQPIAGHTLFIPSGIAADVAGNLFVASSGASGVQVWKIDGPTAAAPGTAHLVAGSPTSGAPSAAGAPADTAATAVSIPYSNNGNPLAVDGGGNLYIGGAANVFKVAHVAAATQSLTVSINGTGGSVADTTNAINCVAGTTAGCTGSYAQGATATLTATPPAGDVTYWQGCTSSTGNTCTVTMDSDKTVTATFIVPPPAAVLTANRTSGQAPLTVHLDASGSTIPAGATFTFFCGDSDTPVKTDTTDTSADCTYARPSTASGWNAYVSMHDPTTNKDYPDTQFITVTPAPDTVDGSAAFPIANRVGTATAAGNGSLASGTCTGGQVDTTCLTVDGTTVLLTAAPGTFDQDTTVSLYQGNTTELQTELGSNVTVNDGFAVTWTGATKLAQPLIVTIPGAPAQQGQLSHAMQPGVLEPRDVLGFLSGMASAAASGTVKFLTGIGSDILSGFSALGSLFQSPKQELTQPAPDATVNLVHCSSATTAGDEIVCSDPSVVEGVPGQRVDALTPTGGLVQPQTKVVAAGNGNVVAAGNGNLTQVGAGNVIAAGAGNVIAAGAGNVIAAGNGNFRRGNAVQARADTTINTSGGNFVAAGGGTLTFELFEDPDFAFATPADPTPPTVTATTNPGLPDSAVFASGPVTVNLAATSPHGITIQNVNYSASGAQSVPYTVVGGSTASLTITAPGTTTITYSAHDVDLNDDTPETLAVQIAIPTAVGLTSGANPGTAGTPVTYTATVSPAPDSGTVAFSDGGTVLDACKVQPVDTTTGEATCTVTYEDSSTHQLSAAYGGDPVYLASPASTVLTETVGQQAQSITLTQPTAMTYGDVDQALTATASSSLPVSLSAGPPGVCALDNGELHAVGAGSCSVKASQTGSALFAAADDVTDTVQIARAALTVTASDATMQQGGTLPTVTPSYSGLVGADTAPVTTPTCTADPTTLTTSCTDAADPNYTISYASGTLTVTTPGGSGGSSGGSGLSPGWVPAGGTASAGLADGTPPTDEVLASVTTPNAGVVSFTPDGAGSPQTGYTILDHSFVITAPPASGAEPLRLVFAIADDLLPAGSDPALLTVFRDGVAVPPCTTTGASAAVPDPCIADRETSEGATALTVLSSHASAWTFGVGHTYEATGPTRVLDTRAGTGAPQAPVGPKGTITLTVPGLPAGASAAVLNLTATGLSGAQTSFVSACPAAQALSACTATSALNALRGADVANEITAPVGSDGKITLYNDAGSIDLVADLVGYETGGYSATGPTRVLDTRAGTGAVKGQLGPKGTIILTVPGLPTAATAAVLNLTGTGLTGAPTSFVSACPAAQALSACTGTSALNVLAGQDVANEITVPVAPDGKITLFNNAGSIELVADLVGFQTGGYTATGPTRVLDTRAGTGAAKAPVRPKGTITLTVPNLPAGTTAAVLNLTGTDLTGTPTSFVSACPATQTLAACTATSALNPVAGVDVANEIIVPVGSDGKITLYNNAGAIDLVADLVGYQTG